MGLSYSKKFRQSSPVKFPVTFCQRGFLRQRGSYGIVSSAIHKSSVRRKVREVGVNNLFSYFLVCAIIIRTARWNRNAFFVASD